MGFLVLHTHPFTLEAVGMGLGASLSKQLHPGLPLEDNCWCAFLTMPWPRGTEPSAQSLCLLPSQVRQNLVRHLATLLILLQIIRVAKHRVSCAGSETMILVSCKLGQNLHRDGADPCGVQGLSLFELLTNNCVLRSLEFRDFLKKALDKNPETRPSAAQLLEVGTKAGSVSGVCVCPGL